MIRRAISLTLMLILIGLCVHLGRRSLQLYQLQQQVAKLDQKFGSLNRFDPGKFWIKLIDTRPDNYGWRIHLPPVTQICTWETTVDRNGNVHCQHQGNIDIVAERLNQEINYCLRGYVENGQTHETKMFGSHHLWRSGGGIHTPFLPVDYYAYKDLPRESFEIEFSGQSQQAFEFDEPIPLFSTRMTPAAIESLLDSKRIDETTAKKLALPRTYYIGTPAAFTKMAGDKR